MKTPLLVTAALVVSSAAFAEPQTKATPGETVLSNRLLQELQTSIRCEVSTVELRAQLDDALAKLKAAEPKKDKEGK